MKELITKEVAEQEINAWLDYKKIKPSQRISNKPHIDILVEGIMCGDLSIDPDKDFLITQKLCFPVDGLFDSLTYKSRASVGDIQKATNETKEVFFSTVSVLTGKGASHIKRMDSEDSKVAYAITVFF